MKVVLKPGREKSVLRRHPWIFSGAIASIPSCSPGEIFPVYSSDGRFLAQAYFHPDNSLAGRILSFTQGNIVHILEEKIQRALSLRPDESACRLINGEGDGIPGLIVDRYRDVLVLQVNTWGVERLKPALLEILRKYATPKAIYEKSLSSARRQDGLSDFSGWLFGEAIPEVEIEEEGLKMRVSIEEGQKTGFFLDQRAQRKSVYQYAKGRKVLNCFAYTGGFSLYALKGGALFVKSIDICGKALALAAKNIELNHFPPEKHCCLEEDVFHYLEHESSLPYEMVILDPPAFAKKRSDVDQACQGYKKINRLAFEKMPPKSILLTCSCSAYIDVKLFQDIIAQAASEAKRDVTILGHHIQASDHPVSLYHPEGSYLKSLTLFLD